MGETIMSNNPSPEPTAEKVQPPRPFRVYAERIPRLEWIKVLNAEREARAARKRTQVAASEGR